MTNFDKFGNILIPHIRNNKTVLYCPRDGTVNEPEPSQTIMGTYILVQEETDKYRDTMIKNAPYDPTAITIIDAPCKICGSKYFKQLRLGSAEKNIKICVNNNRH